MIERGFVRAAGLALAATAAFVSSKASAQPEIAFTFDDLPAHCSLPPGDSRIAIADRIIAALKQAGLPPVYGFVNGVRLEEEPQSAAVLDAWRAAGFPLGNHGWSHMNLNQRSAADWEADVLKDEPLLQKLMGNADWRWLRFPFLAEGDTPQKQAEVRAFLKSRGYRIAGVTMSFGDYAWNEPYARCVGKHDDKAIAELERSYLRTAEETIAPTRAMAKAVVGRDIPYVLLMHLGALDSRLLPKLLAMYKAYGFTFVTLQEAERDPFYREDTDLSLPPAPDSLEAMMVAKGLPLPTRPSIPAWLETVCR